MSDELNDWQAAAILERDCRQAAKFYEEKPGLAGAQTDIDLYRAIAMLAGIVGRIAEQSAPETRTADENISPPESPEDGG